MTLKNVQDYLLLSYMEGFLDEEEFCALYDVNSTDYPVFEHGKYRRFDLNEVSEEECFSRFRFSDKVIPYLGRILRLPEKFVCQNRTSAYTEEQGSFLHVHARPLFDKEHATSDSDRGA